MATRSCLLNERLNIGARCELADVAGDDWRSVEAQIMSERPKNRFSCDKLVAARHKSRLIGRRHETADNKLMGETVAHSRHRKVRVDAPKLRHLRTGWKSLEDAQSPRQRCPHTCDLQLISPLVCAAILRHPQTASLALSCLTRLISSLGSKLSRITATNRLRTI